MNKEIVKQKENLVEEIYANIKDASASIVVEYRGLSVAKLSELRKQLRKELQKVSIKDRCIFTHLSTTRLLLLPTSRVTLLPHVAQAHSASVALERALRLQHSRLVKRQRLQQKSTAFVA